jgi:hypothetical protein
MLRTSGPKRNEIVRGCRKMHEALHNLYSSPNIIRMSKSRRMRWTGHIVFMWEKRNACTVLVAKPEGKRSIRRKRRRLVDNVIKALRETGYGGRD